MKIAIKSPKYGTQYIILDKADKELVNRYKLRLSKTTNGFYVNGRLKGKKNAKSYLLHHILLGISGKAVDHINGNGLDNRRKNLRVANYSQNNKNAVKRKDWKHSKYKGVGRNRDGQFIARIQSNGCRILIGTFKTEIEAARAYNEAAMELHGEFARLNEI